MTSARPKLLHPAAVAKTGMTKRRGRSLYAQALSAEDRRIFHHARRECGLDEEIALLRLQVFLLLQRGKAPESPATMQQTMRATDLIIKAHRAHSTQVDAGQSTLEQELERAAAAIQQRAAQG
jgi:hypothetical protein